MARVQCPNPECKRISGLADVHLGHRLRCKSCKTVFTATALEEAPVDSGAPSAEVMTVVARPIGATRPPSDSQLNLLGRATILSGVGPADPPRRRLGVLAAAVLALVLPVALAAGFVAWYVKELGNR